MEKVLQTIRASSNRQVTFYEGSSLSSSNFLIDMTSNAQLRIAPSAGQFCRSVDDVGNGDVGNDDVGNENGEDGDSVDAVGKD